MTTKNRIDLMHSTAIALNGIGYLLRAPAGAGKSSLALRVLKAGGTLIADDQCSLFTQDDTLIAQCPDTILDKLEVRGIGVITVDAVKNHPVHALINLRPSEQIERVPEYRTERICGTQVPVFDLDARCPSSLARLQIIGDILKKTSNLEPKEVG